ncbi:Crp/Fnr family transcriptional regulator [Chryseobacterium sp. NRRL B-14859]|uniref:Crp/Fnr family transcriptional regulator n=1 Tax=unclassified Chryseobacterium TaxID=2593645 RepID=UPI000F45D883|nr:Crp/Fnr family transcriptional regulator [Chryseobacterium sp. G0240]ROI06898.1 Crp/Fnr family transcriptional regulator [Chryseobacterium sp. G0240]
MVISEKLLHAAGAEVKEYNSGELIFTEGSIPLYYYQIVKGKVKLSNLYKDGKEFIQSMITEGQAFGDSLLFNNKPYPMDAVALEPCLIMRLCKNNFLSMLQGYPQLYASLCKSLSDGLYYQYVMLQAISSQNPAERIMGLLEYLKSCEANQTPFSFKIPLTRQQLANLTGICVETAIRTIKIMEKKHLVKIRNRKIFF